MADPTPIDYAFLILLKLEGGGISNTELKNLHGVRLISPDCARLNASGYVESITVRRPYVHKLTPSGEKLLDDKLTAAESDTTEHKANIKEKQLWAALAALHEYHRTACASRSPAAVAPAPAVANGSLDERIRAAYTELASEPGAWVSLTRLRPLVADVSKADLDRALRSLLDAPDVNLEPEANQKTLTAEDRRASVRIGGEDRHLLAIGLR